MFHCFVSGQPKHDYVAKFPSTDPSWCLSFDPGPCQAAANAFLASAKKKKNAKAKTAAKGKEKKK